MKSLVSTIAGFLLAGAMVASQMISSGHTNWFVIGLAALTAILGVVMKDEAFLGKNKWTSYLGYLQLIVVAFNEAFKDGKVNWATLAVSILSALALRGAADDKK